MKRSLIISLLCIASTSQALTDNDATNAIVGEAASCPYVVKLGIADALHNRAAHMRRPLRGVYGFQAAHNQSEPARVWLDAARAWRESTVNHVTHGATNFGNADDVAKGTFAGMKLTCILGAGRNATYFFKP